MEALKMPAPEHARPWPRFLAVAAAFFVYNTAWAGGFKSLAKELSHAANDAGIVRVAVLPFEPADSSSSQDGRAIAEKLTTQFVRAGRVQTVERSLIGKLLDEHSLARTGIIDQGTLKKLGAVLSVDGIVSGSFVTSGSRVLINARLITMETGVILAAIECEVDREWGPASGTTWFDTPGPGFAQTRMASLWIPLLEPGVDNPPTASQDFSELRDAPAPASCVDAAERVDSLERQILDIKARYWAARLKKGGALADVKVNPGSTISDPSLKKDFYDRVKHWYAMGKVPALTPDEVWRFVSIDGKAYSLYRDCGI